MARQTSFSIFPLVLAFALLPLNLASAGQVLCRSEADDVAALRMFNRGVNAYVELRRRVEAPLSALQICSDPEAVAVATERLAEAIRAERRDAMQGDIFVPEVADLFRVRILAARGAGDRTDVPADLEGEGTPCMPLPAVNTSFVRAGSTPLSAAQARALPGLPPELDYRFIGRALVLVDVSANLVVDVLAEARP
jgi:hypothetical protein